MTRGTALRGLTLGTALLFVTGCAENVPLRGGGAFWVPEPSLGYRGCELRFRDSNPAGLNPELRLRDYDRTLNLESGERHYVDVFGHRFPELPGVYGIFVNDEWIATRSLSYARVEECDEDGCYTDTRYDHGALRLTSAENDQLASAITRADRPVRLTLQGFNVGTSDPQQDARYVFEVSPVLGDYLLDPVAACRRLRADLGLPQ